jgi:hypothetical protein
MSVVLVMPTRGRPARAEEALDAAWDRAHRVDTSFIVAVDADDPSMPGYVAMVNRTKLMFGPLVSLVTLRGDETGSLVRATNTVSLRIAQDDPTAIIGNIGDDHVCRSEGWDTYVLDALTPQPGIAYGNDKLQGRKLPTAPFISAAIVNALGWYALPACRHMFIDDAWKAIGEGIGRLVYLKRVVFEHMHPGGGKAPLDDRYLVADSSTEADRVAFQHWYASERSGAVRTVLEALKTI